MDRPIFESDVNMDRDADNDPENKAVHWDN